MQARTGDSWGDVDKNMPHYSGPYHKGLAADLAPKVPYTNASTRAIPQSFAFVHGTTGRDHPSKPKSFEGQMAYTLDYYPFISKKDGKAYVGFRSDGRTIAIGMDNYLKNGPFFEKDDASDEEWMRAGSRQNFSINAEERYGVKVSSKLDYFVMGTSDVLIDRTLGKSVTPIYMRGGDFQDIGKLMSQSYDVKKSLESLAQDSYGNQLVEGMRAPQYTGVVNRKGTIAAVGPLSDGSIAVFRGINTKKYLAHMAEKYGIDPKDAWEFIALGEEATHIKRGSYHKNLRSRKARIKEERATKEDLSDSIDAIIETAPEHLKGRFRRMRRAIADDIGNVEINYANDTLTLESRLLQEAYDRGYEGEAAQKYVSERKSAYESKQKKDGRSDKYAANKKKARDESNRQDDKKSSEDGSDSADNEQSESRASEGEEEAVQEGESNNQNSNSE